MAKAIGGITLRTTPTAAADNSDLDEGRIKAGGIGLREGEIAALNAISEQLGGDEGPARNAIMRVMIRWAIIEYRAGRLDLAGLLYEPPPTKKRFRLPY